MPVKTVPSVIIGSGSNKSIINNIYNNDFGNTIITGYLTVDYYLTVDGNLTVGGSFDLAGSFELSGDITVKNPSDATVFSVDSATGDTLTKGDIIVKNPSDVTVFSIDSATGDTLTKGDIEVKNPSDVTVFSVDSATGDTIVEGNLTINGTTTTIDSVTLVVEDPVITLAKNANSNPTASTDAGLFLQRGSTENPAIFIWNETLNQFELATVTGATSTTTNFTGGGVTKTFATFKAGDMYGSSIEITGTGSFGGLSSGSLAIGEHTFDSTGLTLGEYGNLNIHSAQTYSSIILNYDVTSGIPSANAVIEVKRGASTSSKITWDESNDRWDFNFGLYLNTDSQIKLEKPTSATTPVILLNADRTSAGQEADIIALEVERGTETNSYLKWDETTDSWEFSNSLVLNESLKLNNNLVPVYLYVRYVSTSLADNEYIYIFSTQDNGVTRDVIRIASLSGSLTENTSLGYYRYKASTSTTYSNGNPPIVDGIIYLDPNKTYYFNMDSLDIQGFDFQVYFSTSIEATPPTYRNVFEGFSVSTTSANIVYSLLSNVTLQDSNIVRRVDDGVVEINTLSGASTVANLDIIPISLESKKENQTNTVILFNSDTTGVPSKSVKIEIERGTSTNSYIEWDETYDYWGISHSISSNLIYSTELQVGYSTFNYLGEYQNEDPIIVVKNPSLDATFSVNGGGDIESPYGHLQYNKETLSGSDNLIPVYIYVKYGATSLGDDEFFYIFTTNDNGVTREIVRLYSLSNLTEYTIGGHYSYLASASVAYNNTSPTPTVNAIAYIDPNKTYYFYQETTGVNYPTTTDLAIYVSSSRESSAPSYRNLIFFNGATAPANYVYLFKYDTTWQNSDVVRREEDGVVILGTLSASSTLTDRVEKDTTIPLKIKKKLELHTNTTAILLNSDETESPTKSVQIEVERGTETNSYIKWSEASDTWEIFSDLKVLDSSSNSTLLLNDSSIFTYKPLSLNNSLFYKVQRISSESTDIDSDVSFVVMENGALGSDVFQPSLPNLDSDTIGGRVLNIAVKGANYVEIYPATISQYIRHGGTTYSLGNPLVLSGYSSVQLISHIVGVVKDWYVTAISNSDKIDYITASGAITIFNGKTYHCNPAGTIALTLGVAPNGTQLTFRSISAQTTTITTAANGIEGNHNTITLNSDAEGLSIYYYGTSWWVSSMYGNVGITTV